jgi:DNA-binding helix-hairpin-helix protein with protein kinase domain
VSAGSRLRRASTSAGVSLGQVLGRGGEGTVYAVAGAPKLVAKVYKKPPGPTKCDKLRGMVRRHSAQLLEVAAWPVDLLLDEHDAVRGFLMGRITARQDAHRLYSPKSRRRTFPDADFRFLVRAATNLARAFAQVHATGHVIGDVNHGNALIGKDGTASLIDCDSFQITDAARSFPCDVGSPLFTPPELQGKAFRGLLRTASHDCFGLAVLLFHLLFQGRHPFAGRYREGDLSVEQAIAESRFAYGVKHEKLGMTPPPGTLPLDTFGPDLAALFERAFAPPGTCERPAVVEWIEPLLDLESSLLTCVARPRHFHPPGPGCCWCGIEALTGTRLFHSADPAPAPDALTPEELWKAIEAVPPPTPYAPEPEFVVEQGAAGGGGDGVGLTAKWLTVLVSVVWGSLLLAPPEYTAAWLTLGIVFGVSLAVSLSPSNRSSNPLSRQLRAEWNAALSQWRRNTSGSDFFRAKAQLGERRRALENARRSLAIEMERLKRQHVSHQYAAFLDSFEIDKAHFTSVTPAQVRNMLARGIRSAGDVQRQRRKLKSFVSQPALRELETWVDRCGAAYSFDASDPDFVKLTAPLEAKRLSEHAALYEELLQGPQLLANRRADIEQARIDGEAALREKYQKLSKQVQS